jgi:hypothetical protein
MHRLKQGMGIIYLISFHEEKPSDPASSRLGQENFRLRFGLLL